MATQETEANKLEIPNISSNDFGIVSQSPVFVDKTMLIKKIFDIEASHILIAAPNGFGKSTNLNMVKRFVEMTINKKNGIDRDSINYKLFKRSKLISEEKNTINNYFTKLAVIQISFKDVNGSTSEALMNKYAETLSKTFSEHKYLLKSYKITDEEKETLAKYLSYDSCKQQSKNDLEVGIGFLAKMLSKHCKNYEIFAFVDDYDIMIFKAFHVK